MEAVHTSHRLARSDPVSGSCVSRLYATCDWKPSVACVLTARYTPWEPRARRHSNTRAAVRAQRPRRSTQAHLGKQSCPEQNLRTTTSGVCLERACLHSRDLQQRGPRCVVEERGSHRLCPPGGAAILPPARHSPPGWHARPPVLSPGACKQQAQRFPPGPAALAHPRSRHPPLRKHLDHVNDLFLDLRHRTRRTCQTPHAGTSTLLFLMHSSGLQFNKARLPAER